MDIINQYITLALVKNLQVIGVHFLQYFVLKELLESLPRQRWV